MGDENEYGDDFDDVFDPGWAWEDAWGEDDEDDEDEDEQVVTRYSVNIDDQGRGAITVVEGGEIFTVTSESPDDFAAALIGVQNNYSLAEIKGTSSRGFTRIVELDSRVQFREGDSVLLFDGVEQHSLVAETVIRYYYEGRDYMPLIRFMERLATNVSDESREHLFKWSQSAGLKIAPDGHIIGYKGIQTDDLSVHSGGAYVDGEWVEGQIPNRVGSVVTMPRDKVNPDPFQGCSYGLHVGSLSYATGFGQKVVVVLVDPADVVAVPQNEADKMRTCKYHIIGIYDTGDDYETEPNPPEELSIENVDIPRSFLDRLRKRLGR